MKLTQTFALEDGFGQVHASIRFNHLSALVKLAVAALALAVMVIVDKSASAQVLTPIFEFTDTNTITPTAGGFLALGGTLYGSIFGAVYNGGGKSDAYRPGVLFKLATNGSGFTNIHVFSLLDRVSLTNADGANPQSPLVLSGDTLYGVTENGSPYANGTIFSVHTDGTGFTNLYQFSASGSLDGATPCSGLVLSGDILYGATGGFGPLGGGTIFAIHTNGSGFTNLYSFSTVSGSSNTNTDGSASKPSLILSGNRLYGTATRGGFAGEGTIFCLNTDGTDFTNLHNFSALVRMTTPPYLYTNLDGINPGGSLIVSGGKLYGVTTLGGVNTNNISNGGGTVFSLNTDGSGFTTLRNFGLDNGFSPQSLLLSGNVLYGTTQSGGSLGQGVVFAMNTDGADYSLPVNFTARVYDSTNGRYTNSTGAIPAGSTAFSGNTLYGMTEQGGLLDNGLIYALNFSVSPPPIQFTATPTNGAARLTVQFNAPATDSDGNGLVSWAWNFGDSSNSVSAIQNPTHIYTNVATFVPSLTCINTLGNTVTGFGPVITATVPPPIQFTATPTNGLPAPVTVHFTSPSYDANTNAISFWNWRFGDGGTSTAQNPTHIYTNSGSFFPSLACTNYKGDAIAAVGPAVVVPASLLLNGGFEAGSLTNWSLSGYSNLTRISTSSAFFHSGRYGVELDAPASKGLIGFIGQTFATLPGAVYLVSFWLNSPSTITPNDFQVSWNGVVALDETNLGNIGWTNIQLTVTAASTNSTLQFGYLTGLYFGLDDVLVTLLTSPARFDIGAVTLSGTDLVLSGSGGQSGHACRLLVTTDLSLPLNQWTPVSTNQLGANGNFSITATNALASPTGLRFYSLQLQ